MDEIPNPAHADPAAIVALPALTDNYIWLLRRHGYAAVVDPGDAAPVLDYLGRHNLALCAILITHHHGDHTGGVADLLASATASLPVFGPADEPIDCLTQRLRGGERIDLRPLGVSLDVLAVPGHTRAHLAYYSAANAPEPFADRLFCGDTLFSCGCGRVFEGTPPQLRASLERLAALPGHTRIHPAHEYTQANIRFALAVEPENAALHAWAEEAARLRAQNRPTLPTTLDHERAVNPFLRWNAPAVITAASHHADRPLHDPDEVFTAIRAWKNVF